MMKHIGKARQIWVCDRCKNICDRTHELDLKIDDVQMHCSLCSECLEDLAFALKENYFDLI